MWFRRGLSCRRTTRRRNLGSEASRGDDAARWTTAYQAGRSGSLPARIEDTLLGVHPHRRPTRTTVVGEGIATTGWETGVCERLRRGDPSALSEAYDQFAPAVTGLAFRVTRCDQAAEEICQEVFLRLWERPAAFDPSIGPLRSWLAMLTHRRSVDWVRREVARKERQARDALAWCPRPTSRRRSWHWGSPNAFAKP